MPAQRTASTKRSIVKALTYRIFIVCLDLLAMTFGARVLTTRTVGVQRDP